MSLLTLPRTLAANRVLGSSLSSSKCCSIMGFGPLDRRTTVLPSRKLVIQAARAESKGVSRVFRAPDFEVMFICNHCRRPFGKHLKKDIVEIAANLRT